MPPGFEPLLAAVCAAPWDDLPRLVFADWLDDHGWRARAEFIRLQCDAARGGPNASDCQSRADQLLHRHKWSDELPRLDGVHWASGFKRGFTSSVSLHIEPTPDRLASVFQSAPVERLSAYLPRPRWGRQLVESLHLAGITRLDIGYAGDAEVGLLATNPALVRLQRLQLTGGMGGGRSQPGTLTDVAAWALVQSPYLSQLRWLRVFYATLSPDAHSALVNRFGTQIILAPRPG